LAYFGGASIEFFQFDDFYMHFGIYSYPLSIFWFLLLINAINFIDGLDGLAGGISFFVCVVMTILLCVQGNIPLALLFSVLAGSLLGFLFYNSYPASIFLGDSGSYFLGYLIAGLSVYGSVKSQVSTSLLLPIVALGIPIADTLFAPLRRLANGRNIFKPDKAHVHHALLDMGYSVNTTVWILYVFTIFIFFSSLALVTFRNQVIGFILLTVSFLFFIFSRKIYLQQLKNKKTHAPQPSSEGLSRSTQSHQTNLSCLDLPAQPPSHHSRQSFHKSDDSPT